MIRNLMKSFLPRPGFLKKNGESLLNPEEFLKKRLGKMRHILELTLEEKKDFLKSFDTIFTDCDGVIWTILTEIPGAGRALNLLKDAGKRIVFVSNNSMRTDEEYKEKFEDLGLKDVIEDDVVHPVKTISRYLKERDFTGSIFVLASKIFEDQLREKGFDVTSGPEKNFVEFEDFLKNISVKDPVPVRAVVIDIDVNLNLAKLIKAQHFLKHPDCNLIVGASDKLIPLKPNFSVLGPYYFYSMLKEDSGKKPIILGKPGELLGDYLKTYYKIRNPGRAIFFGDALAQDIGFGRKCGFQTLAFLSGATTKPMLFSHDVKEEIPDLYADSLADFIEFFKDLKNN